MVTILLEQIIEILKGWLSSFTSWAEDTAEKLGLIEEATEYIDNIYDNTDSIAQDTVVIKSDTGVMKTTLNNANARLAQIYSDTSTIKNNVGSISTSAGTAAAFAEDCATNTLNMDNRLVTIGSDTTQIRTDSTRLAADVAEIKDTLGLYLYNTIVTEDAEGAICNIDTDLADYLQVLKALIVATESGSGTKSPTNPYTLGGFSNALITRSRKNLFDKSKMVISTQRFVKYGVDNYSDTLPNGKFKLQANQAYTFSFSGANSTNFESIGVYNEAGTRVAVVYNNNIATFTPESTGAYFLAFAVSAGNWGGTWDNYDIQLEVGSTATPYEPYTATQTTIALGQTVYGGEIDCLTGMLKITHGYIASYNGETVNEPWISSIDEYTPGGTITTGAEVIYPLTTPTFTNLTPIFIKLAKGISNIWTDTGDTALTYRETLKHYLKKQEA